MPIVHSVYREAGRVQIDDKTCTRCGACVRICPSEVLIMQDGKPKVSEDSLFGCIACGHCMMVCPNNSILVTGRGISPEDLLPLPEADQKASTESLAALMRSRRSVRRFQDREVEPEVLDGIVGMAASAPMGIPPWDVGCVVVRGREKVREVADKCADGYEMMLKMFRPWVLTLMRPLMKRATYEQFKSFILPLGQLYVAARRKGRDLMFYDAPAVLIFYNSPYADMADTVIACTYAMLAAESFGLGTTIIGGAPPVLARNKALCRSLGIPDGCKPSVALIAGYPASQFRRSIRRHFLENKNPDHP